MDLKIKQGLFCKLKMQELFSTLQHMDNLQWAGVLLLAGVNFLNSD